eukprot:446710_1
MATKKARKRSRSDSDEDEYVESDDYDEPPRKRTRRSTRKRNTESEDDNESSDIENTNTSNNSSNKKMNKLLQQIKKLKKENKQLKKENNQLKKKAANNTQHKQTINGKKYFQNFAKQLVRIAKSKKTKFIGWDSIIEVEQINMDKEEFDQLFDGKGNKKQPLPNYRPTSMKTIIKFDTWDDIKKLFSDYGVILNREIQISKWSKCGMCWGKMKASVFLGKDKANVDSLSVEYNKSSSALVLKFNASIKSKY